MPQLIPSVQLSRIVSTPAVEEIFLTEEILKTEYNIRGMNNTVKNQFLGKSYGACEGCALGFIDYCGGHENDIRQAIGWTNAVVKLSHVLWHVKQQRAGQPGLLSLDSTGSNYCFIKERQFDDILVMHWYSESKCWGIRIDFYDPDETDP